MASLKKMLMLGMFVLLFAGCKEEGATEVSTVPKGNPKIYNYDLCIDQVVRFDTVGYQSCCEANNACWKYVDSAGVRLNFPVLKERDSDDLKKSIERMNNELGNANRKLLEKEK